MNTLHQAVQDYLTMRRDLGFKLREAGDRLLEFAAFMRRRHAAYITSELALAWAQQPSDATPTHWAQRLSFVRGFARYRSATDPCTQIPPPGLLPFQPRRARPYLYSDEEISRLLRAALAMRCRCRRDALRPRLFHCLFGLLSVTGLRLSEALNLKLSDVDLDAAVLTIRGAKCGKDRLVPLHASTCHVLSQYLAERGLIWADRRCHPTCSPRSGAIDLVPRMCIGLSMPCRGRSACAASPTATGHACMTCVIASRRIRSCAGTNGTRTLSAFCRCCRHISGMSTSPIRSGI